MSSEVTKVVVFAAFGVGLGAVVEWVLHRVSSPIPYTVIVFYVGIIFAVMCKVLGIQTGRYIDDSGVSSAIILYGLLPTLLFSETMHINLLHFRQSFVQSSLLAGPGGVIVACLLAMCSYLCLPFNWSWNYNFLFGSIMCATDPVSVVALLKSAKASSALSTIIAGESLLNDGSAMILYFFFYNMINGTVYTPATFVAFLAEMLILSPLIGVLVGLICFYLTRKTSRPTNLNIDFQIMFCFAAAYGSYYIAGALLEISGVLACCAAGVTVALLVNPSIVEHPRMHEVWHLAEWVCNTLIFLLGGFIGGQHTYANISVVNVVLLIVMYIFLTLTRAVMLAMLFPAVSRIGMRMTVPDAIFVTSAGLRGALAIALALDAARNADDRNESDVGGQFFFIVTGLVSMTLLINGSTSGRLLLWLKLAEDPNAPMSLQKTMVLLRIKRYMKTRVQQELEEVQGELGDYDEGEVARLCQLQHSEYGDFDWRATVDEFAMSFSEHGVQADAQQQQRGRSESSASSNGGGGGGKADLEDLQATIDHDLVVFARKALLDVVRARYMDCIHTGKIGNSVMASKILLFSVDVAHDYAHLALKDWETVQNALTPSNYGVRVCRSLDEAALWLTGSTLGLLPYLDAFNERNALYTLINYIDAHEYALDKLQFILGMDEDQDQEQGGDGGRSSPGKGNKGRQISVQTAYTAQSNKSALSHFSRVEAHQVILETLTSLESARELLKLINPKHLKKVYSHRAARMILIKQEEILHRLVTEGILSDTLAHTLFDTLAGESDRVNLERASHDRRLIRETRQRKVEEELQMRESLHAAASSGVAMTSTMSFSHSKGSGNGRVLATATQAPAPASAAPVPDLRPSAMGADRSVTAGVTAQPQSAPVTQLFRVNTMDSEQDSGGNSPVANRTSLRSHLTGDDSMRASVSGAGKPRPSPGPTPPASPLPVNKRSSQQGQGQGQEQKQEQQSSGGSDTMNPLSEHAYH